MKIKRTVSMLLCLLMVLTALPVTVFAGDGNIQLVAPKLTLSPDYKNGGLVYTLSTPNPHGVAEYHIDIYEGDNADSNEYVDTIIITEDPENHTTGRIALSEDIVADTKYTVSVTIMPEDGYSSPSAVSDYAYARKKVTGISIDSNSTFQTEYDHGEKLDLSGLLITVKHSSSDKTTAKWGTAGTVIADVKASIDGVSVNTGTELNAEIHNGKTIKLELAGYSVNTSTIYVSSKLKAPTKLELAPDFVNGGLKYTITDENSASAVDGYVIVNNDGDTYAVTSKTGNIPVGTLGVSGNYSTTYTFKVYAKADPDSKVYSNSGYSTENGSSVSVKKVSSVKVTSAPTLLSYNAKDKFNAAGLAIEITHTDGTKEPLAFERFADLGITVSPEDGTELTRSHNGNYITVTVGNKSASTRDLTGDVAKTITIKGKISTPTITLKSDYANGGFAYSVECIDSNIVGFYDITIYEVVDGEISSNPVGTITTQTSSGNIGLLFKNTSGVWVELTSGSTYAATVVAKPYTGTNTYQSSNRSEASNSAVAAFDVTDIDIYGKPTKITYKVGEKLDYTGLTVNLFYSENSTTKSILVAFNQFADYGITVSPANGSSVTSSMSNVTVKLGSMSDTFEITIGNSTSDVYRIYIDREPDKTEYKEGDKLDLEGLVVEIEYRDGKTEKVEYGLLDFYTAGITTDPKQSATLKKTDDEVVVSCGGKTAKFDIEVTASSKTVTDITITSNPDKLVYEKGDKLDLDGLEISVKLKSGTVITEVEPDEFDDYGIEVEPADNETLSSSDETVRVYYSDDVYDEFDIYVGDAVITKLQIEDNPDKIVYQVGDSLDLEGLVVRAYFKGSSSKYYEIKSEDFSKYGIKVMPDPEVELTLDDTTIVVYYGSFSATNDDVYTTFNITVRNKTAAKIEVATQPTKLVYTAGEKLDLTGLVVKVYYSLTNTKDFDLVPLEKFSSFGIKTTPADGTALTVAENDKGVKIAVGSVSVETAKLTVTSQGVVSMTVTSEPTKLKYNAGEKLSLAGLKLKLTYADGTTKTVTYSQFEEYNIESTIKHGSNLTSAHNNRFLKFTLTNPDGEEVTATLTTALKVETREVESLTVLSYQDTYAAGDSFDKESLTIMAKYADGTSGYIAADSLTIDPRASLSINDKTVTIYFGLVSTTVNVYVYELDVYEMIKDWRNPFTDIHKGQWFYQYAGYMNKLGVITPVNGKFNASQDVTRAMFITMLWKLDGSPKATYTGKFTDVKATDDYATAVQWAINNGITQGTSGNTFSPATIINREQMVTFLYRYAQFKKCDVSSSVSISSYPDQNELGSWFVDAMKWAIAEGIVTGVQEGTTLKLLPKRTARVDEASKILTVFHIKFLAD